LPLILGLFLRILFPFLRRWRRILPSGPASGRSRAAAKDLTVDRREAHDAPAATLEPEPAVYLLGGPVSVHDE